MCLGIPGKVVERCVAAGNELAAGLVEFDGLRRKVCLELVPEAGVGDFVIVHAGIAITTVDAAEAESLLQHLKAAHEFEVPTDAAP
jgi:hydrogenase expression/formation protein HypC